MSISCQLVSHRVISENVHDQLRMSNRVARNVSHDSGNLALRVSYDNRKGPNPILCQFWKESVSQILIAVSATIGNGW